MALRTLKDLDVRGKKVLVRADFNVPLEKSRISDDSRITATLPTIKYLQEQGATIILMSHLGRPKGVEDKSRLKPVATHLSKLLGKKVLYKPTEGPASAESKTLVKDAKPGSILLLENTRFDKGEEKNDAKLAKALASLADVYVNDAFGAAHRAHASTEGVAHFLPGAAGLLLEREITVLSQLLGKPKKPFKVILGGAKVSDKIGVIENLLKRANEILIGGAMAYTFIKAQGGSVGKSLVENDKLELALEILAKAKKAKVTLHLPKDSRCATEIKEGVKTKVFPSNKIPDEYMGLDAGPEAIKLYQAKLATAKTVLWNGPLGVFETKPFDKGTFAIAKTVAKLKGFTVVGGGDSVAAINEAGVAKKIDHISTGGGASLELLEGITLPGVAILSK
jgi:phosphoglycerate kinase